MHIHFTKDKTLDFISRLIIVIIANILLSFATVWFLEPASLYSGGATGLAQLIKRLLEKFGVHTINLGWFIFFVNIPITLVGFKFVSAKFTIFSLVAVGVQTVSTILIPDSPFTDFKATIDSAISTGESIDYQYYGTMLTFALTGGALAGVASGIALRFGTSTGGFDVLGQALALKKNISIGYFTMVLNILIAIFGGAVLQGEWIIALFTIIRMILNSLVIDKIHTAYAYVAVRIFSDKGVEISHDIMEEMSRGCTIEHVTGAHSDKDSIEVYSVVSSYEVDKVMKIIRKNDPKAFVTTSPVKSIKGNFVKHTII